MKQAKILTVVFAVVITCLVLCLTVSADYSLERQVREEQLKVLEDYCNGEISYDEYISRSNELTMQLYDESSVSGYISSEAEKIGNMFKGISNKIGTTAQTYGDKAYQYIADCIWDFLDDYEVLNEVETTDKYGYGTKIVARHKKYNLGFEACWDGYIEIEPQADGTIIYWCMWSGTERHYYEFSTGRTTVSIPTSNHGQSDMDYNISVYGDVRYPDGSEAPTDDTTEIIRELDFTNATDSDLDRLLQEILEALERQEPDLSNVEGLLESIYFRLGTLDKDSDNALLAEINAAILSLANSNNANTSQLILKLDELKQALTPEGETETPEGEQQPTDLTEVINELKEINAGIKGLAVIETVENIWELTEGEQQLFNEYASLIPIIVEKMGLSFIQASMNDIESLIFTSSPPSDLTVEMYGAEYAILSRDMFNDEALRYVNLAKNFVSVLLIYAWCLSMRKKITGGDG